MRFGVGGGVVQFARVVAASFVFLDGAARLMRDENTRRTFT